MVNPLANSFIMAHREVPVVNPLANSFIMAHREVPVVSSLANSFIMAHRVVPIVNSLANSFITAHREVGASGDCAGLPTARSFMVHSAQGLGSWTKASSTTFPFSSSSRPVSLSVTHTGMLATLWQYS